MRVGFMTPFNVDDPMAWSGVVSPMFSALAIEVDLVHLEIPTHRHHAVDRAATRLLGRVGHGYLPDHSLATSRPSVPGYARSRARVGR